MASHARIYNLTRRFSLKRSQAIKAVEQCACAWVEFGVSVRDLTIAESIAARNAQKKNAEPLPLAEIPHVEFRAPERARTSTRQEMHLAVEANQFARLVTAPQLAIA